MVRTVGIVFFTVLQLVRLNAQPTRTQYRFENGIVSSEGTMRDGKPDGFWRTYYPNGQLKTEGNRRNFQLDSTWNFYAENGKLQKTIQYEKDIRKGQECIYDESGNKIEEYTNEANIKNGKALWFFATGEIKKQSQFVNNKEDGKAVEFDRDGRTITLLTYRNGFIYTEERINRYDEQGRRTGIWKDLYENGTVSIEGNWSSGMKNGVFKFFNRKGELEKLERYENDSVIVDEAATAILDIRKEYYSNGNIKQVGTYREGKKQGNFRIYDENGNETGGLLYDNDVLAGEGGIDSLGRRQGDWKLFYQDGTVRAKGNYVTGLREGPWTYFYSNARIEQSGIYKTDKPTGAWKWFFTNGQLHREDMYRNGKEEGTSIEYDSTGNVINEGEFVAGARNGKWKLTVNDHSEEGQFLDGERDGLWKWFYGNGERMFEGEFQSGVPVNRHKYWYDEGQVEMTGKYKAGEMEGRWDYFDNNGFPLMQLDYKEGVVVRIDGQKIRLPEQAEE